MKAWVLFTAAIAFSPLGHAINVCTDASGNTVYQDHPCQPLPSSDENQPIATPRLTAEIALRTVQKFQQAMSRRDALAATSYLSSSFSAEIQTEKGSQAYDRSSFSRMLTDVLSAAKEVRATAQCGIPVEEHEDFMVTCDVDERMTLLNKDSVDSATEVYAVTLENDTAKFSKISSIKH